MVCLWPCMVIVRISLLVTTLFLLTTSDALAETNVTLEISSQFPDDFESPMSMKLQCQIPQSVDDKIQNLLGISVGKRKGHLHTKLASISVFTPDCVTFGGGEDVKADGEISGDSGFLYVQVLARRDQMDVDEYTCMVNFMNREPKPDSMVVSERSGRIRFYTMVANEFSDVKRQISNIDDEVSKVDAKIDDEVSKVDAKINDEVSKVDAKINDEVSKVDAKVDHEVSKVDAKVNEIIENVTSCSALRYKGLATSARQIVTWPSGRQVLCDTETDGGGWTIFQRRQDGKLGFYRGWDEYEKGFGDLDADFWLGLRQLNYLMHEGPQELRVDLKYKGQNYYAKYSSFHVDDFRSNYKLRVKGYSGTEGDSLRLHDNRQFSTYDAEHDTDGRRNCAAIYTAAWWYNACHDSSLNGVWKSKVAGQGVNWRGVNGNVDSAEFTELKTRPAV